MVKISKQYHIIPIVIVLVISTNLYADNILNVPECTQEYDEWCWTGVSWTILQYYLKDVDQCEIAEYTRRKATFADLGLIDCCDDATQGCNHWNYNYGPDGSVEDILRNWGIINYGRSSTLSKEEIEDEISDGHPFMIRWGYTSSSDDGSSSNAHFIVGHGITKNRLYYMDPWPGEGLKIADYDWVVSNSQKRWTNTNIIITDPIKPVAKFTYSQNLMKVDFVDKSSSSLGSIVSWLWDFGDGNSSSEQNPDHIYQNGRGYLVALTVTDNEGKHSDTYFSEIVVTKREKEDLVGSFTSSDIWGVLIRNSYSGEWQQVHPHEMDQVCTGDIDGNGIGDLVGVWSFGINVYYDSGRWENVMSGTDVTYLTTGDMNGDGKDDIIGSWTDGIWWLDVSTGSWNKLYDSSPDMITSGDIDGDKKDDLIGVWDTGIWIKYYKSDEWIEMAESADPVEVASGDMDGNGIDEIIGSWVSGVWMYDALSDNWKVLSSISADHVAAGDLDGNNSDDLIGVWSGIGTEVIYSKTDSQQILHLMEATSITTGKMR